MTHTERLSYEHRIEQLEAENQRLLADNIIMKRQILEIQRELWTTRKE